MDAIPMIYKDAERTSALGRPRRAVQIGTLLLPALPGWAARFCLYLPMLTVLTACGVLFDTTPAPLYTTIHRLNATFDDEPLSGPPSGLPSPNPPNDSLMWGTQWINARVVTRTGNCGTDPTANCWVRVEPNAKYVAQGQYRAFVMYAFSEPLNTGRRGVVNGRLTLSMRGSGHLVVAIRAAQFGFKGDPLGGFAFHNPGFPSIASLSSFQLRALEKEPGLALGIGTYLSTYTPGVPVDLQWSINQVSRTVSLGFFPAAATASVSFEATASDGTPNTPIQRIWLEIILFEMSSDATVFLDDFFVEEI